MQGADTSGHTCVHISDMICTRTKGPRGAGTARVASEGVEWSSRRSPDGMDGRTPPGRVGLPLATSDETATASSAPPACFHPSRGCRGRPFLHPPPQLLYFNKKGRNSHKKGEKHITDTVSFARRCATASLHPTRENPHVPSV